MKIRILIICMLILPTLAFASNHYVLPSPGTGTNAGTDWANACSDFTGNCAPGRMVRGDTYYVGGGSYSGTGSPFNVAASGTSVISILGATAANSGTVAGWSASYSVSSTPATFTNGIEFDTSYWVWDGTVGPAFDYTPSHYGFSFGSGVLSQAVTIGTAGSSGSCGSAVSNVTIAHFYGKPTSSDVEKEWEEGNTYGGVLTNITITNFLIDGWQGLFMTKSGGCSSTPYTGWIVQYGIMLNGFSSSANHGEWIDPNERAISGLIVRYNVFRGHSGSAGMTGTIVANNSDNDGAQIYGNVFDGLLVGNGVITGTSAGNLNNAVVYDNTFLNTTVATNNPIGGSGQGNGNVAHNNLIYNMSASFGGGFTNDYDSFFSTSDTPSETHGQTGSGNPFVNSSSYNYALSSDTATWTPLPAPYNVDPDGVTRTSSRGAYQLVSTGAPAPPTGLAAIVK